MLVNSTMPGVQWPGLPGPRGLMRLALLHQLASSQWWTPQALAHAQLTQLQTLVAHARQHAPFHAQRLAHLPPQLAEADWLSIPILTRRDVQQHKDTLCTATLPPGHGKRTSVFSSGSTGQPVATEQTDLTELFWDVFTLRDHEWHRRDLTGKLASLRHYPPALVNDTTGNGGPNWGKATADLYPTGPVAMLNVTASVEQQLKWLRHEDPDVLLTHPTVLDALLRELGGQPAGLARLREVRTLSEALPEGLRERCQQGLGVPLTDLYSARETGYLALQCPDHPHYHVQSEGVRVEVLREDGQPCLPGEVGRVVVTPLHNFAFPLIRYDIGDYAELGDACPCGRGLTVLTRIMGRQRNRLVFPDGRRVWPILNYRSLNDIVPVQQMRMVQRTPTHIDVELVTPVRPEAQVEARLAETIRRNLGHPFELTFIYQAHLPRSAGGKFEDFLSLVDMS